MQPFGYERPTPHLILTDNIHSDTQAEPWKLSSLTLYIDLWQEGEPTPGQNPPVISPPVVIFRRIGVRAEIHTQNPVLSNTRLVKMVPLSHLRRPKRKKTGSLDNSNIFRTPKHLRDIYKPITQLDNHIRDQRNILQKAKKAPL
jgi:hypothetical protein